jgi:hypothetical protein
MIIALLIALALYMHRRESEAWELLAQANTHEALTNPDAHGHKDALDWSNTCNAAAERIQAKANGAEAAAALLGRWVLGATAALSVLRIAASAFAAAAAAGGTASGVAGWTTVVDGIDTLLWLALVV